MTMDNETKEKAVALAGEAKKKAVGILSKCAGKIGALWKSGVKGKVICIVGVLVILGIIGAFSDDEEGSGGGGGGGGGGDWKFADQSFANVFNGFPKDEGIVYKHAGRSLKVMQSTKKGNLVENGSFERVVWVETKRRYEDGESLDKGYYIRSGSMEYETALGAEKRVARYVEVTDKVQKQLNENKSSIAKQVEKLGAGKTPGETKTIAFPGGVTMEMVWCPPGTFTMGKTSHQVTLTKGFWMGKTEVTQKLWKSVMGNNPSDNKGDDLPVEYVDWNDCQEFCKNTGLQLPTEAQWEYACRAGSTGPYAGTGKLKDMGWYDDNSDDETHPVGTKQPNAWGLYDMHGNVWEWCVDWYGDYSKGAVTDPKGSSSGSGRAVRGGSCRSNAGYCTSSYRESIGPSSAYSDYGFRLVRTLSE
jgi:formylglycine-generating enzyme required for sulfatase activity